jgi:hypothetical protein
MPQSISVTSRHWSREVFKMLGVAREIPREALVCVSGSQSTSLSRRAHDRAARLVIYAVRTQQLNIRQTDKPNTQHMAKLQG